MKMTEKKLQKSFVNREKVFIFALANLKRLTDIVFGGGEKNKRSLKIK